jgi:hypothetical protein
MYTISVSSIGKATEGENVQSLKESISDFLLLIYSYSYRLPPQVNEPYFSTKGFIGKLLSTHSFLFLPQLTKNRDNEPNRTE